MKESKDMCLEVIGKVLWSEQYKSFRSLRRKTITIRSSPAEVLREAELKALEAGKHLMSTEGRSDLGEVSISTKTEVYLSEVDWSIREPEDVPSEDQHQDPYS